MTTPMIRDDNYTSPKSQQSNAKQNYFTLRTELLKHYKKHYEYWLTLYKLEASLALAGLLLQLAHWDATFESRYEETTSKQYKNNGVLQIIVLLLTILAIGALIWKDYCAAVWHDYQNPYQFSICFLQHDRRVNATSQTEGNRLDRKYRRNHLAAVFASKSFWVELAILLIMPYPGIMSILPTTFTSKTTNWVDNTGQFPAHSNQYTTEYWCTDILLSFMFVRVYIVFAAMVQLTSQIDFQGKRICYEHRVAPTAMLQLKAILTNQPLKALVILLAVTIVFFSFILQIFERPYYQYDLEPAQLDFITFGSSAFVVIITLTSVGYGDVVPSTRYGRFTVCLIALWGAFMMSLVVAVLSSALFLKKSDKAVIDKYKERKYATRVIQEALTFNVHRKAYQRQLTQQSQKLEENNTQDNKSNKKLLNKKLNAKAKLESAIDSYKSFKNNENEDNDQIQNSSDKLADDMKIMKADMTELNQKLTFLATCLLKSKVISVEKNAVTDENEQMKTHASEFTEASAAGLGIWLEQEKQTKKENALITARQSKILKYFTTTKDSSLAKQLAKQQTKEENQILINQYQKNDIQ